MRRLLSFTGKKRERNRTFCDQISITSHESGLQQMGFGLHYYGHGWSCWTGNEICLTVFTNELEVVWGFSNKGNERSWKPSQTSYKETNKNMKVQFFHTLLTLRCGCKDTSCAAKTCFIHRALWEVPVQNPKFASLIIMSGVSYRFCREILINWWGKWDVWMFVKDYTVSLWSLAHFNMRAKCVFMG